MTDMRDCMTGTEMFNKQTLQPTVGDVTLRGSTEDEADTVYELEHLAVSVPK